MNRLFSDHKKRRVIDLDGGWLFIKDEQDEGREKGWCSRLPDGACRVTVPSLWNNELGMLNYEGACWYEKRFYTEGGTLRFVFESVMTAAEVWLDGGYLGSHYGGFTEVDMIAEGVCQGEHTLVLRVDNSFDESSIPQRVCDWFNYGGIARSVSVEELSGVAVLSCRLIYELADDLGSAKCRCRMELYNADDKDANAPIVAKVGDTDIFKGVIAVKSRGRVEITTPSAVVPSPVLWDVGAPKLYTLEVKTPSDDLIDRVGFRRIEVKDGEILLNGKPVTFRGVNRHEEHPDWGFAFPAKLMKRDLDLIEEMNCNSIRGSHYPNSRIFLDMLDERGVMFWSEIPIWGVGFGEKALSSPKVVERGLEMHREMTKQYYNHPSIVIYGMHNEIRTELPCAYEMSQKYAELLRAEGGNRLITHASSHPFEDSSMEFDDVICINAYKGWYGGRLSDWDTFVEKFDDHRGQMGLSDKPVIMSEFGAAALSGYHSHFDTVRWSEEYQSELLEYAINLFDRTDYMRGTFVWQFCNIRTSPSMDINRARYFNNKGIVDEYRNPKAAYFKVREIYGKIKKRTQ